MSILLFTISFFAMEFVAWFTHKYVMHGFLWNLHEDHHVKNMKYGFIEKNDSFFLIFAIPGIVLIILGSFFSVANCLPIGLGITAYGFSYLVVHDVIIHQRVKWFRNLDNKYLLAIRRAHKMHHKHLGKEDGECFGMLLVPYKYLKAEFAK